jgi:rhodanese-related sulfurtransferase
LTFVGIMLYNIGILEGKVGDMKRIWLGTAAEICLIVTISASVGIFWNRTLLTSAWRGELAGQAQAAAPKGAEVPMPLGLMQIKEMYDAKQAVIIDARSAANFAEGHIAGALPLPLEEARKNPAQPLKSKLPADTIIIAYCNGFSCHDSMDLGKILMSAGYASVYVFEGGYPEWRDAGYPIAKGAL